MRAERLNEAGRPFIQRIHQTSEDSVDRLVPVRRRHLPVIGALPFRFTANDLIPQQWFPVGLISPARDRWLGSASQIDGRNRRRRGQGGLSSRERNYPPAIRKG